jgi:aryl-alcohol dehydrogenase-like predicted oxidoreductase
MFGSLVDELGIRNHLVLSAWMASATTQTAAATVAEAERALGQLGMDHVDIFYLDWTCTPEQIEAMVSLRDRGLTRLVGVLGQGTAESSDLSQVDALLLNHNYHWRDREPGLRRLAADNPDVGMITLEPLGRGRFAQDEAEGVPAVSACLKYALALDIAQTTLIAVRRLEHLNQNIATWRGDLTLTDPERAALEAGKGYEDA